MPRIKYKFIAVNDCRIFCSLGNSWVLLLGMNVMMKIPTLTRDEKIP